MIARGYFGIGIVNTKNATNVGTLWRSALNFGADFIFTVGRRYKHQSSDTVKAPRHIPLYTFETFSDFVEHRPFSAPLIGVEQSASSVSVNNFVHPERAIYLLGAEDHGLPNEIASHCQAVIHIETPMCLNVAVAGSIVMFDRASKTARKELRRSA